MNTPVLPPATSAPAPSLSRSSQYALGVLGVVVLVGLAARLYQPRLQARPTDREPNLVYRLDLNRADVSELAQLDGVGPALAESIVTHRREQGPFTSLDQLDHIHGIGPKTLDRIRSQVQVEPRAQADTLERLERKSPAPATSSPPRPIGKLKPGDAPINVNRASDMELMQLPGIGVVTAQKIVEARSRNPFQSVDDLRQVKGIGVKTLEAIRPYVKCSD